MFSVILLDENRPFPSYLLPLCQNKSWSVFVQNVFTVAIHSVLIRMAHIAIHKGVLNLHEISIQSSIFLIQTIICLLSFIKQFYSRFSLILQTMQTAPFTTLKIVTQPLV